MNDGQEKILTTPVEMTTS